MTTPLSRLAIESREVPAVLRRQAARIDHPMAELTAAIRKKPPMVVVTCGRGSSAHAATYGKHLFERYLNVPVAAAVPNIASVYRQRLRLAGQLFLAISQSGRSTDLLATAEMARSSGALTAAIVNDPDSTLAQTCEFVLPMEAGPELSIAASKSFIASLAVLLRLTAEWAGNVQMRNAVDHLPDRLIAASQLDWSAAIPILSPADSVITIGRGPTLAIAREAALKLKEACNIHAEAFSSAEFQHGPISLVERNYPVFAFTPNDAAGGSVETLLDDLRRKGAAVIATRTSQGERELLPTTSPEQPEADAICLVQAFYRLLVQVAARRGNDIDRPRHLQKVTSTR
jgi:glutamine---fructose-6-phosphate transaminase (isomerizing)